MGIHDKVYPKELDSSERGLPHDNGTDEGGDQSDDIDSQLELKESSDVVIDISSPLASFHNGGEVVILDNNIGSSVGNLSTGVHGEADVGLSQGWRVVGSVSSDSNDVAELPETGDHNVLVVGSRSGEDLQVLPDVLHLLDVANFFLLWLFSQNNDLLFGVLVERPPTNSAKSGPVMQTWLSVDSFESRIPHSFPIAIAVTRLSPVTILTLTPAWLHCLTAPGTSSLMISLIPAIQTRVKPPSSTL